MAPELSDILPMVRALPEDAKEELFAFLGSELKKTAPADKQPASNEGPFVNEEPFVPDPNNPMLGLFADDPELADEIVRMAMHDRAHQPWRTPNE